jgi:hypothetical protein
LIPTRREVPERMLAHNLRNKRKIELKFFKIDSFLYIPI